MQAEAALDTLNKKDLGEAKSLKKPPAGVDDVTAVIIILLEGNPKDKSWAAAQKLMNNVDKFMERLKTFKGARPLTLLVKRAVSSLHKSTLLGGKKAANNLSTAGVQTLLIAASSQRKLSMQHGFTLSYRISIAKQS
jgi:Microtubule-binding stalk of dynein motor